MRRAPYLFLLKAAAVMSPVLLFIAFSEAFLAMSGETTPIHDVALRHLPGGPPGIYSPMFFGSQSRRLHLERIFRLRPKVLALGSSRVERFREEMFAPGADFYNACQTIRDVASLRDFVNSLPPDYAPQAVLIGVDCWWVNRAAQPQDALDDWRNELRRDDTQIANAHLMAFQNLADTVWQRDIARETYERIFARDDGGLKRYGVSAWSEGGYRNDGSYQPLRRQTAAN
jgi:hypothetical protein